MASRKRKPQRVKVKGYKVDPYTRKPPRKKRKPSRASRSSRSSKGQGRLFR